MSLFKKLAGETVIYGFGHVLGKVLNYVLIAFYLTRKLSENQAEYGIYIEMYFYVAILLIFLGLRMETTFFRFGNEEGQREKAFGLGTTTMLISGLIWLIVAWIFAEPMATILSYPDRAIYIKVLSGLLAVDLLIAMPLARMRLESKPGRFVSFQAGSVVLNILFVLFFLELCPRLGWTTWIHQEDILLDVFLANLWARVIILLLLGKDILGIQWNWDSELWKKMLIYAWPLVLVGLAGVINQSSYIILQKYFLTGDIQENLSSGGVYGAAAKIALLMSIFVTAYNFAAEPFFFNQTNREDAPYIYAQMARAFTWLAAFLFLIISLFTDVFQLIVGAEYREAMYVVPIILMGYVLLGLYYNIAVWYKVADHTKFGALISIFGVIVTFAVNLILLPQIGIVASAWASLLCYLTMLVLSWWWGKSRYPVPYEWGSIFLSLILAGLIVAGYINYFDNVGAHVSYLYRGIGIISFLTVMYFSEKKKWQEWVKYQ